MANKDAKHPKRGSAESVRVSKGDETEDTRKSETVKANSLDFSTRLRMAMESRFGAGRGSQARLIDATGIPSPTIVSYLDGRSTPNVEKLSQLADALGCSVDWLLFGRGSMNPASVPSSPEGQAALVATLSAATNTAVEALAVLASAAPLISDPAALSALVERLGEAYADAAHAISLRLNNRGTP